MAPPHSAFCHATSISLRAHRVSLVPPTCSPRLPFTHGPRTGRARVVCAARPEKVQVGDEAFATCTVCGSDEVVSAEKLGRRGTLRVRCSQCRNEFTADVATALTYEGTPLRDVIAQKERDEDDGTAPGKTLVKLYIAGLGAKVNVDVLQRAIEAYGEVTDVNIVYDRVTKRSRGFAFVTVAGRRVADAVISDLNDSSNNLGRRLIVRNALD